MPRGTTGPIDRFGFPGITFTTVAGNTRWNWPCGTSPSAYAGPPSARGGPNWLASRPPASSRSSAETSSTFDRPGCGNRAVVALEEVLDANLPVRSRIRRDSARGVERSVSTRAPPAAESSGSPPSLPRAARPSTSRLTNTNGPHAATATGAQPELVASNLGSRSARGAFINDPVEAVRPRVVRALDVSRRRVTLAEDGPRCRQTLTKPCSSPSRRAAIDDGSVPAPCGRELAQLGDLLEADRHTATSARRATPARAPAPPGRRTSRTAGSCSGYGRHRSQSTAPPSRLGRPTLAASAPDLPGEMASSGSISFSHASATALGEPGIETTTDPR